MTIIILHGFSFLEIYKAILIREKIDFLANDVGTMECMYAKTKTIKLHKPSLRKKTYLFPNVISYTSKIDHALKCVV